MVDPWTAGFSFKVLCNRSSIWGNSAIPETLYSNTTISAETVLLYCYVKVSGIALFPHIFLFTYQSRNIQSGTYLPSLPIPPVHYTFGQLLLLLWSSRYGRLSSSSSWSEQYQSQPISCESQGLPNDRCSGVYMYMYLKLSFSSFHDFKGYLVISIHRPAHHPVFTVSGQKLDGGKAWGREIILLPPFTGLSIIQFLL